METQACRNRRDPVARFNTFEEAETAIKAQIENASRTQRAIRGRSVPPNPMATPLEEAAPTALRKLKALDYTAIPEQSNGHTGLERHSLERTFSFNSLSTLRRDVEAARFSQWRDSPVSAFSPTDRVGCSNDDVKPEAFDAYPPLAVYTLKQSRKDEKEQKKSIKRQEKEQKKADKVAAHKRRHSMAIPPDGQVAPVENMVESSTPKRAISDPSFKASKDAAVQLVKKLTAKPMNKLSRRCKVQIPPVPHVDDFASKPRLQEYLNSTLPAPDANIAELPGSLPPYTPFQNATVNENNSTVAAHTDVERSPLERSLSVPGHNDGLLPQKMMRCDNCQFGIKLDEQYLHCSRCGDGDRLICTACDAAGESCRHELTRRTRQVLGYHESSRQNKNSNSELNRRHGHPPRASTFGSTDDVQRPSNVSQASHRTEASSARNSRTTNYEQERKHLLDLRDLELRRREQDIIQKEREGVLKECETMLQERQTRLQEREAEVESKVRLHQADVNTRDHFARQCSEMAILLGSQFASLQTRLTEITRSMPTSSTAADADGSLDVLDYDAFRSHAGKRKASGKARAGSGTSARRTSQPSLKPITILDPDSAEEDEDEGSGTPKKLKQDPENAISPGKLYACHFCKYDSSRYSERNNSEKQYRGCSSGYWPDISRLKQHLYRVHWRGHHCQRCFKLFKKTTDLQEHSRRLCEAEECPYPEKFELDKYNEIRKKRPANTPEEVWYIIFDILFPGQQQPATPYADSVDAQKGSFSSPQASSPEQRLGALGDAFESRLDQHQNGPEQAWLRDASIRDFIREQLRASMADVLQQMTPSITPAATPLSSERSPRSANDSNRRLSIPQNAFSMPASPVPLSATSTRSTSSTQWRLPNHRRSFSRPLLPQTMSEGPQIPSSRPILTLETVSTPSEITFNVTTPGNPENDQYDDECSSWHQNDDSLGLAITTDNNFDFEFQGTQSQEPLVKTNTYPQNHDIVSPLEYTSRPFRV